MAQQLVPLTGRQESGRPLESLPKKRVGHLKSEHVFPGAVVSNERKFQPPSRSHNIQKIEYLQNLSRRCREQTLNIATPNFLVDP